MVVEGDDGGSLTVHEFDCPPEADCIGGYLADDPGATMTDWSFPAEPG